MSDGRCKDHVWRVLDISFQYLFSLWPRIHEDSTQLS